MIFYAINACKQSKLIDRVFVSSEDEEIKEIAKKYGAEIIDRPVGLADAFWTQDVLKHAVGELERQNISVGIIARIQANSPMVESEKIDEAINKLRKHNLYEVFSVDQDGFEDAAIHVLKRDVVFQEHFSVYKAVIFTDYIDVHYLEDVKEVEKRWGHILCKITNNI
jgi:CMP-2-keto-3-deoxyoctulosonic acid synthetase